MGNTRASFRADGNTLVQTAKTDFDPWGVILKSSQGNAFANRFELQEKDLTFGLNWVNFGARRMNPSIGRMDNIDAMASKFSSHTLYNYALNNPLVIIDPDGNESRDIWGNTTFNGFVGDDGSGNFVGTIAGGGGDDKEKGKKQEEAKKKKNSNNNKFIIPHNDGIEPDYTLEALFIPILKPIEWLITSIKTSLFASKIAAKGGSLVKIGTVEGDVMMFSSKIGTETVEGISNFAVKDGKLYLNQLHLQGSSAGNVGRESLWNMAKDLGKQYKVKEVIIQGGKRTTGKYKGTVPSPITIKVD